MTTMAFRRQVLPWWELFNHSGAFIGMLSSMRAPRMEGTNQSLGQLEEKTIVPAAAPDRTMIRT
jgi:hypothetical protein